VALLNSKGEYRILITIVAVLMVIMLPYFAIDLTMRYTKLDNTVNRIIDFEKYKTLIEETLGELPNDSHTTSTREQ